MTRYRERLEAGEYAPDTGSAKPTDLGSMSKAELVAAAQAQGISPANNDMTKEELKTALEEHAG